jgi:CRP-like cAMP-binding protein
MPYSVKIVSDLLYTDDERVYNIFMDEKTVRYLKKLPLFNGLPDEVLKELADKVTSHQMEKGELLFNRNDPGDSVYFVQLGWIKVILTDSGGNELVINQIGPGEIIGEMSLVDELPRSAGAIALSPLTLLRLGNTDFRAVIDRHPKIGILFAKNISERLRFNVTYLQNAVEWSYRIAQGDYNFVLGELEEVQSTIIDSRKPDDARARQLLSAFFEMVKGIKEREDNYKKHLRQFNITLDETQREEDVEAITSKTFFRRIQSESQKLRSDPQMRSLPKKDKTDTDS